TAKPLRIWEHRKRPEPSVTERNTSELDLQRVLNLTRPLVALNLAECLISVRGIVPRIRPKAETNGVHSMPKTYASRVILVDCFRRHAAGARVVQAIINAKESFGVASELGLVEQIEKLHSELQSYLFAHFEILVH